MQRTILLFGVAAGLIVAIPMFTLLMLDSRHESWGSSQFTGYSIMLVALSLIFFGVKRYRDKELGGVIKFLPAFLMGLGISLVAGVIYVAAWEVTLMATNYAFANEYAAAMIESLRAKGASAAEIEKATAQMAEFSKMYANPLFRLPLTFIEPFPVGVIVSLITAALLRNPRVLPARAAIV
jgi:Protein of unknown function (DUF4199)